MPTENGASEIALSALSALNGRLIGMVEEAASAARRLDSKALEWLGPVPGHGQNEDATRDRASLPGVIEALNMNADALACQISRIHDLIQRIEKV